MSNTRPSEGEPLIPGTHRNNNPATINVEEPGQFDEPTQALPLPTYSLPPPPPPPRTNTPQQLRRLSSCGEHVSARALFSGLGVMLLVFFLYLTISSTLHPPPMGPGQKPILDRGVLRIFEQTLDSRSVWDRLAEMTDLYGPRLSGSAALEKSIDWIVAMMREDNLSVTTEEVTVDYWQRNSESLTLLLPTQPPRPLRMLGLGGSIGTDPDGIEAEVVVVRDLDDLATARNATLAGKIVLFNTPWESYRKSAQPRIRGAIEAEKYGAKAVLVRSATPFSLDTPHTGSTIRANIPAASVTSEDADYLSRLYNRHLSRAESTSPFREFFVPPRVRLIMNATFKPKGKTSRNIIAEVRGSVFPEEIVVIGGHIDSWDVGSGVIDDAGGFFVAWEALKAISQLARPPRRTIRLVGWVNEENGAAGSTTYVRNHQSELENHVFAIESDIGVFQPWGLSIRAAESAMATLRGIGERFLIGLGSGNVTTLSFSGADIGPLCRMGVPCGGFLSLDPITGEPPSANLNGYFYYHHSSADSVSVLDPAELARCSASIGVWAYVIAEIETTLEKEIPSGGSSRHS